MGTPVSCDSSDCEASQLSMTFFSVIFGRRVVVIRSLVSGDVLRTRSHSAIMERS